MTHEEALLEIMQRDIAVLRTRKQACETGEPRIYKHKRPQPRKGGHIKKAEIIRLLSLGYLQGKTIAARLHCAPSYVSRIKHELRHSH